MTELEQEDLTFDKCVGLFRLTLNNLLSPLRIYGQSFYVDLVTEEVISLAVQLHQKLSGIDEMPYYIDNNRLKL